MNRPIGVFDSGIGGLTVLKEMVNLLPNEKFVYYADSMNAPYGYRKKSEIIELSSKIVEFLIKENCKVIVIACNTATAAAVHYIRQNYNVPIVGLEPAVKPACLATKTGQVGVLATEGTFRGNHFKTTSEKYKEYVTLHLQVAKGLVQLAEKSVFEGDELMSLLKKYIIPMKNRNIDQLVLGCTHYPLFIDKIKVIAGENINILDSGIAVARRTKDILMINKIFNTEHYGQKIKIFSTNDHNALTYVVSKLFQVGKNPNLVEIKIL